ncbi:MAG: putative membrane protein YfcA [Gammaproteobacteria bacterium]|jgi:uncharacterized membrane protein YfcA
MTALDILFLSSAAFCTSALTAVVGAGGGTALIAIMLQIMSPAAALPVHGAVQLASNTSRVWLFRKHMAWPIIIRFVALMPFGVALGLLLFQGLATEVIQGLIGCFVLLTLATRQLKALEGKELPLWAFVPLGFATGILNMIVGVIAPILGVLVIRKDLNKEQVVGTLGFFGFTGNLLKIAGFTLVGFSFGEYGWTLACMVPAAVIGTRVGKAVLSNLDERYFMIAFRVVLLALGLKLIVFDGLAQWWI